MLRHGFLLPTVKEFIVCRRIALLALAAYAALAACTSHPLQVRVDRHPVRNVTGYTTFGFHEQPSTEQC
jgi:hypothetical protein